MMSIVNNVLNILFPPRHTETLVADLTRERILAHYLPQEYSACIALASYRDPHIRACVQEMKFHNSEKAAELLGALLATWAETHISSPTLLVPIPLSRSRYRKRGYNQVTRIAAHACMQNPNLTLETDILCRTRNTKPQTELDRTKRLENLLNAFAVRDEHARRRISGSRIILLDDVYTTGTTMHAAGAALLPHAPASLTYLAIAH